MIELRVSLKQSLSLFFILAILGIITFLISSTATIRTITSLIATTANLFFVGRTGRCIASTFFVTHNHNRHCRSSTCQRGVPVVNLLKKQTKNFSSSSSLSSIQMASTNTDNDDNNTKNQYSFIDIGANLLDEMYQGKYRGKERHDADLNIVLQRAFTNNVEKLCWRER